jgi:hypothetical protein
MILVPILGDRFPLRSVEVYIKYYLIEYEFYNSSTLGLKYVPYIDVDHYRLRIKDYMPVEDESVTPDQVFVIPLEFSVYSHWKVYSIVFYI